MAELQGFIQLSQETLLIKILPRTAKDSWPSKAMPTELLTRMKF
jgi:hypothetical protein